MAKENQSFIQRLFRRNIEPSKDELEQLDQSLDEFIKNQIPNLSKNGRSTAYTDTLSKFLLQNLEDPQYALNNSKSKNNGIFKELDLSSLNTTNDRKNLYNIYRYLCKNIPQLDTAIDIIVENILSPDELFKEVLMVTPNNKLFESTSSEINDDVKVEANAINTLLNTLNIEEYLFSWLSNALLTGNSFIEIINVNKATNALLAENSNVEFVNKNKKYNKKINDFILKEDIGFKQRLSSVFNNKETFTLLNENGNEFKDNKIEAKKFLNLLLEENVFNFSNDSDLIALKEDIKKQKSFVVTDFKNYMDLALSKDFLSDGSFLNKVEKKKQDQKNEILKNEIKQQQNLITDIILKHHDSENVIKISNSGFVLGYLVIKTKDMTPTTQNKLFGMIGNVVDLNKEADKMTTSKLTDTLIDKLLTEFKKKNSDTSITKKDLDNPDVRRTIASIIMEKKTADVRFVKASSMIEFINYSKYNANNEYGTSILDSCLFLAKYYIALITSYTIFNITREFHI